MLPAANEVLEFWFGDAAGGDEDALQAAFRRWFSGGSEFDETLRLRFGADIELALGGGLAEWERDPRSRLALILLLDQFTRNVFRRTAKAFAGDARAFMLSKATVENAEDDSLKPVERVFLLMPYQHSEDIDVQRQGVQLFEALAREPASEPVRKLLQSSLQYAHKHCQIIERFGRFPYRNEVLGRASTDEELAWLEGGERFGQ